MTPDARGQGSIIRPYGDTTGDGMVQLSFTLPMPHSKVADGTFGTMKRPSDGGRGLDGVAKKSSLYFNPANEFLEKDGG